MSTLPRPGMRLLLALFLLSFAARVLLLIPVINHDTPPKFDELSYFKRAVALVSIMDDLIHFRSPHETDQAIFYARGIHPPFQPICLALGMALFGKTVTISRFVMVFLSSLTTILIFLLSARLAGPRAGTLAALLHIVHPSFLMFSHYLWSETTYIFLLFLSVHMSLRIADLPPGRKRAWLSLLLGLVLGGLAMTRAAAVLTIFIIPGWIFIKTKVARSRIISLALIGTSLILTVLPWERSLYSHEKRFVLISTFAYRNLYIGHNQWRERERADADGTTEHKAETSLREYSRARSISAEQAARELALKEILSHPWDSIIQGAKEFIFLWTYDFFPLRHIVNVVYPPLSDAVVYVCLLIFILAALVFGLLVLKGFLVRTSRLENKALILVLVAAGTIPYIGTFGNTRFNLPQVALLLPVAGFGLANLREKARIFPPLAALAVLILGVLFYRSYPDHIHLSLRPSSHYLGSIGHLDRFYGTRSQFGDAFVLQRTDPRPRDELTVTIVNNDDSDYSFNARRSVRQQRLSLNAGKRRGALSVFARNPRRPLVLSVHSRLENRTVLIEPTGPEHWRTFLPVGLQGISINWTGGR